MADSSVAVTAGSGTSIDTRTEASNGNHRQVVVLGDPSTNAGVAPVDATNGLAVEIKADLAKDRTADNMGVALQTDAIMNDTTVLTPKYAAIAASSSGDNTLVAAVAAKKIRVLSYTLVCASAVTCRFEDGAGGTALSGQMSFAANGGISVPFNPVGYFETTANTLLNLELGGAVSVAGHLTYIEV